MKIASSIHIHDPGFIILAYSQSLNMLTSMRRKRSETQHLVRVANYPMKLSSTKLIHVSCIPRQFIISAQQNSSIHHSDPQSLNMLKSQVRKQTARKPAAITRVATYPMKLSPPPQSSFHNFFPTNPSTQRKSLL